MSWESERNNHEANETAADMSRSRKDFAGDNVESSKWISKKKRGSFDRQNHGHETPQRAAKDSKWPSLKGKKKKKARAEREREMVRAFQV